MASVVSTVTVSHLSLFFVKELFPVFLFHLKFLPSRCAECLYFQSCLFVKIQMLGQDLRSDKHKLSNCTFFLHILVFY